MPNSQERLFLHRRYPVIWMSLAVGSLVIFASVLITQDHHTLLRWAVFLSTDPQQGSAVFRQKGCVHCHAVNGIGGKVGPDLGGLGGHPSHPAFLVTAMWNHAPKMWERMRREHFTYPNLTYEEAAPLMAYLYMASHMDGSGDAEQGKLLFTSKRCIRCHAIPGKNAGQDSLWVTLGAPTTPMAWTEAIWASAPEMEDAMQKAGIAWPTLDGSELNDLFAYVRQSGGHNATGAQQSTGDPERGWRVFQTESCIKCHELKPDGSDSSPNSRPEKWSAASFSQVGELMWNHAPEMVRDMQNEGIEYPRLADDEMTDLAAFLFSLRYFDPPGSSVVGRSIFNWRGCNLCHGENAEGTKVAPALRGEGKNYNSISLATALWSHGQKMYNLTQKSGLEWPAIQETDIGDLLAFLNSPMTSSSSRGQK